MSDLPHGTVGHSGYNCERCEDRKLSNDSVEVFDDPDLGRIEILHGEHSTIATNGKFGGWVETRDGALVSTEYARSLNRKERRKRGIRL